MTNKAALGDPISLLKEQPRPVFIVGMNGSGTSMLADCLGQHPEMYATPWETKLIPYLMLNIRKFGDLDEDKNFLKLWSAVLAIPAFTKMNSNLSPELPSNWRNFPRDLAYVIDAVFRSIATLQNKQRWGEKSPQNIQHIHKLAKLFQGAKFIHIIRDGRDCAASFQRRWHRNPEYTIYRWKHVVKEGQSQGFTLGDRYFEFRYEDITSEPDRWLRKICNFIDLPFHKNVLFSNQPYRENWGTLDQIKPNSEKWKIYFGSDQIKEMEIIAGKFLFKNGYDVNNTIGDKDPNVIRRNIWKWSDFSKQFIEICAKKLSGQSKKTSWKKILNIVSTSIKQLRINRF
jgi:hypothetical protein